LLTFADIIKEGKSKVRVEQSKAKQRKSRGGSNGREGFKVKDSSKEVQ